MSVVSPTDVWAVGGYQDDVSGAGRTLALHWNGTTWSQAASPTPGSGGGLNGVSALSSTDVWAVGDYTNKTTDVGETLVLHWNGTKWLRIPSPNPATKIWPGPVQQGNHLAAVSALSPSDVWAVGWYKNDTSGLLSTLALHWDGTAWSRVSSPSPGPDANDLSGVSARSASDVWAVGSYSDFTTQVERTLVLHWNGTKWSKFSSPNVGSGSSLSGVSARASSDAWAVGTAYDGTTGFETTLILRWNGAGWTKVASPNPGPDYNLLFGVSADAAGDAWAVGQYFDSTYKTLALRWNGSTWSKVKSPSPSAGGNFLMGVSADSTTDAWAVGNDWNAANTALVTLAIHWNGTKWVRT